MLALLVTLGAALPRPALAANALDCEYLPKLLQLFLQRHISMNHLNDELRERALDAYVKRLDPSKTLYLPPEAATVKNRLRGVFHDVQSGNCVTLLAVQADLVTRIERMEEHVRGVLRNDDYAVDTSVTLILDPDKRSRPPTAKERDAFVLDLLHFQMTNYLANDLESKEAREKLIHRYELITMRAKERDEVDVFSGFVDAFATALDPHSNYLSAEAMEDFQIGMGLSLEGIGVALSSRDGYSVVEKIIPGGAADQLDILEPKDKIIGVAQEDGEFVDIIDMSLRDVVRLIRGTRGTKVHLTILRQGETTKRFDLTIVREKINLEEQAASLRFETIEVPTDGVGLGDGDTTRKVKLAVLDLPSFYGGRSSEDRQASRDLRELLAEVKKEKAEGLLLDLSRNGGGLLNGAIDIAGFFIDEGGIVAVKSNGREVQVLKDPAGGVIFDGPMVVLTSRISASASEIVAGAMKDYGRAVLVGDDHTFGKGTVQSMHPLPEGLGALKVTTALFFRPGGFSTQLRGVSADVVIPSVLAVRDVGEEFHDYSLAGASIEPFAGISLFEAADISPALEWQTFDQAHLGELQKRSTERVASSEEFEEIQKEAAKVAGRDGVVHLADLLEDAKDENEETGDDTDPEAKAGDVDAGADETDAAASGEATAVHEALADTSGGDGETDDEEDEDEPSAQQREALRILADHVVLLQLPRATATIQ